jgi:endonuclease YncB( thermonuclease family)
MQPLRIALGLLALVTVFFMAVPAETTLFSGRRDIAEPATIVESAEAASEPAAAVPAAPASTPAVRAIDAAPIDPSGLTRLPAVASGAATPPSPGETAAVEETPAAMAATPAPEVAAAAPAAPDGPFYRLFPRPIAVDARTLKTGEVTLLVEDVEPVAGDARCADGAQAWPCATRARTALRGWIRGRSLMCAVSPDQREAREISAPCLLGEADVGDWVVRNGWALATPGGRYEAAEREARDARRGVWAYGLSETRTAAGSGG